MSNSNVQDGSFGRNSRNSYNRSRSENQRSGRGGGGYDTDGAYANQGGRGGYDDGNRAYGQGGDGRDNYRQGGGLDNYRQGGGRNDYAQGGGRGGFDAGNRGGFGQGGGRSRADQFRGYDANARGQRSGGNDLGFPESPTVFGQSNFDASLGNRDGNSNQGGGRGGANQRNTGGSGGATQSFGGGRSGGFDNRGSRMDQGRAYDANAGGQSGGGNDLGFPVSPPVFGEISFNAPLGNRNNSNQGGGRGSVNQRNAGGQRSNGFANRGRSFDARGQNREKQFGFGDTNNAFGTIRGGDSPSGVENINPVFGTSNFGANNLDQPTSSSAVSRPPREHAPNRSLHDPRTCFQCGHQGHVVADCTTDKRDWIACGKCDKIGHITRECRGDTFNPPITSTPLPSNDVEIFLADCGFRDYPKPPSCVPNPGEKCKNCGRSDQHYFRECPEPLKESLAAGFQRETLKRVTVGGPDFAQPFARVVERADEFILLQPTLFSDAVVRETKAVREFRAKYRAEERQKSVEPARVQRESIGSRAEASGDDVQISGEKNGNSSTMSTTVSTSQDAAQEGLAPQNVLIEAPGATGPTVQNSLSLPPQNDPVLQSDASSVSQPTPDSGTAASGQNSNATALSENPNANGTGLCEITTNVSNSQNASCSTCNTSSRPSRKRLSEARAEFDLCTKMLKEGLTYFSTAAEKMGEMFIELDGDHGSENAHGDASENDEGDDSNGGGAAV